MLLLADECVRDRQQDLAAGADGGCQFAVRILGKNLVDLATKRGVFRVGKPACRCLRGLAQIAGHRLLLLGKQQIEDDDFGAGVIDGFDGLSEQVAA